MQKDLRNYRRVYDKSELLEDGIPDTPMLLFQEWFNDIEASDAANEANAMTLSTVGVNGYPKSRVVLLKEFSDQGFVFFTNYLSEKGIAIANHPEVCLSFFWAALERQVIIKGKAEKIASADSDSYFKQRPEGSQLGALVSPQSSVIASREVLEDKLAELEEAFKGKPIERPQHWGGYIVKPISIEFWQGRPNRLHDRMIYTLEETNWRRERLAP